MRELFLKSEKLDSVTQQNQCLEQDLSNLNLNKVDFGIASQSS